MKFTAVGDVLIGRRLNAEDKGLKELAPIINKGEVKFFNLETTLNKVGECYASENSGGTWLRTNPEVLDDVKMYGFNMTSFNNNHAMDYSFEGLLSTLDKVEESGLVHAGVGRNLAEAAAPKYLDTPSGRVALISLNSDCDFMVASEQTNIMKGRPGVNPLRHNHHVELEAEDFDALTRIIKKTGVNIQREMDKRDGYYGGVDDTVEEVGGLKFKKGEETRRVRTCNTQDLERVKKAIYEAQLQADYIVISVHSHDQNAGDPMEPTPYLEEFVHFCIDNGAHCVIGHGPHLLRPIEIYKGRPIFYSLGDFVLQLYNVEVAPEEFYNQYGLTAKSTVHELLKTRSKDFKIGLMQKEVMNQTVIPYWEMKDGKVESITLYPVSIDMTGNKAERGLPRLDKDAKFMDEFARRCALYGTTLTKNADGTYSCSWKK